MGGWQLGGLLSVTTGPPVTPTLQARNDITLLKPGGEIPDLVPGANSNPVLGSADRWFDSASFVLPPARTIGNAARGSIEGPGLANIDMSLSKNIAISDQVRMQFRTEVFNVLNRANLALPVSQVLDRQGRPRVDSGFISSTTTSARQIQFGLRLQW